MKLVLKRTWKTDVSIIGLLYLYDEQGESLFRCFTLEDVERTEKIKGMTAIPKGEYEIVKTYSPKFNRPVPMLVGVPNFERVYIHGGNDAADTEGCILVGFIRKPDKIERSREAVSMLYDDIIFPALSAGTKITISIE